MLASRDRGRQTALVAVVALATFLVPLQASAVVGDIHGFAGKTNGTVFNDWIILPTGGYSGDGGLAQQALLDGPRDVAFDQSGNAYIADTGNDAIRRVDAGGTISTRIRVGVPVALATGPDGLLYVATGRTTTAGSNQVLRVRGGGLELVAGNGTSPAMGDGGPATAAGIDPRALAFDADGNLYIADTSNHRVRRVSTAGVITTFAGVGGRPDGSCAGNSGDGGAATAAGVCAPAGLAFDSAGRLLIMSEGPPALIRRIDSAGRITTIAGSGACVDSWTLGLDARASDVCSMRGMALDARGNIFFSTIRNRAASHVMRVDGLSGRITRVAGLGCEFETVGGAVGCFAGDGGPALAAGFNAASSVRFGPSGELFVVDTGNNAVRFVEPSGFLSVTPSNLAFGDQEIGIASAGRTATVTNTGTVAAHISTTGLEGANPGDFLLQLDDCAGRTLLPGTNCRLIVAFRPSATGPRSASIRLVSDAPEAPETPTVVGLSGNGISVPRIRVTPNPVFFGNHRIGTTTTRTVTVASVGSLSLSVGSVSIVAGSLPDYSISADGCSGATLIPGASCTIDVSFTPVENGFRDGTLRVPSNAGPPVDVALIGSAGPLLSISPLFIDFGGIPIGTTSPERVVTVSSIGSDPAFITSGDLGGANADEFVKTFDACSGRFIIPGETCSIGLAFRPRVVGVRTGRLDVVANAPPGGVVSLTGTGIDVGAPISRFVTADHSIVLGFAEPILGESDDPTGGISRVVVSLDPIIGATLEMNANLICNQGRTHCSWWVRVPLTLIGPVLAHASARDVAGNVEVPGPTISVIMV
jgi:sugar lactone lactonase YvrE